LIFAVGHCHRQGFNDNDGGFRAQSSVQWKLTGDTGRRRITPLSSIISFIPQSGLSAAPVYPSVDPISGYAAKNDTVLHTFSRNALSARFTPNGAIFFELQNVNVR